MPLPVRLIVTVSEALLVTVAVVLKAPVPLGANVMLTGVLWPAARVSGRLGEFREKHWPEKETLLIVTDPGPEFATVVVRVLLLPSATLPKFRLTLAMESAPDWMEDPVLNP